MSTPTTNLFHYATSELSQDAFICYLLAWAHPYHKSKNENLHKCGTAFIQAIFEKHGKSNLCKEITDVEIKPQYKKIDVFCIINKEFAIIIEDKTWTENHSDQLKRYYEAVKKKYPEEKILRIYYKNRDQGDYSEVKEEGYQLFLREDILKVLNTYEGNDQILQYYKAYLQEIEDEINLYKTLNVEDWEDAQWIGFFLALQRHECMEDGSWGKVNNESDGFLGFWWGWYGDDDDCEAYLQLEEDKLCFRIEVEETDSDKRRQLRDEWHNKIMAKSGSKEFGGLKLKKPKRFGNGTTMAVCVLDGEYLFTNNGIINMDETTNLIINATKLLKSIAQ